MLSLRIEISRPSCIITPESMESCLGKWEIDSDEKVLQYPFVLISQMLTLVLYISCGLLSLALS